MQQEAARAPKPPIYSSTMLGAHSDRCECVACETNKAISDPAIILPHQVEKTSKAYYCSKCDRIWVEVDGQWMQLASEMEPGVAALATSDTSFEWIAPTDAGAQCPACGPDDFDLPDFLRPGYVDPEVAARDEAHALAMKEIEAIERRAGLNPEDLRAEMWRRIPPKAKRKINWTTVLRCVGILIAVIGLIYEVVGPLRPTVITMWIAVLSFPALMSMELDRIEATEAQKTGPRGYVRGQGKQPPNPPPLVSVRKTPPSPPSVARRRPSLAAIRRRTLTEPPREPQVRTHDDVIAQAHRLPQAFDSPPDPSRRSSY